MVAVIVVGVPTMVVVIVVVGVLAVFTAFATPEGLRSGALMFQPPAIVAGGDTSLGGSSAIELLPLALLAA